MGINDFRIGGAQKLVTDLLNAFDGAAYDLHVITLRQPSANEETFYDLLPNTVTVHKLHFLGFTDLTSWRSLVRLLKNISPDVVCSHLFFSNTVFRILRMFVRYRVIVVEHNVYVGKKLWQRLTDCLLAIATFKIVAVSPRVLDHVSKTEWIPKRKLQVIQNGINVEQFRSVAASTGAAAVRQSLGFEATDKVIICVGQLIRQKNHALLIEAFAHFVGKHADHKLIVLGEGILRSELQAQIDSLNMADRVKLLGVQKQPATFYAASDFFVLPSLFEGFALVCIEAMACGLPVIATRVAGPDVYIQEGENGYFTNPDAKALAERMDMLASLDSEERNRLSHGARTTADQYDLAHTASAYTTLFESAVGS